MPIGAHPVPVLPVSPFPLAGRISQRTRSRTAAAQRLHHDVQHDDGEQSRVLAPSLNSCSDREYFVSGRAKPASANTAVTFAHNPGLFNSSAVNPLGLHSVCAGSVTAPADARATAEIPVPRAFNALDTNSVRSCSSIVSSPVPSPQSPSVTTHVLKSSIASPSRAPTPLPALTTPPLPRLHP